MNKDEIDAMWQKAMKESIKDGEMYTRYHFAKMVAERALADPMHEVQRLGQEIEQERTWVGLTDDEIDYLIHLAYTGDEEFVQTIEAKLKEKNLPCIKPKWIGLTEKEHTDIAVECGCMSADWVFYGAAVERKLKEKNT